MAGADSQPAVPERPANKEYDSVAWHDITAKQKQRDSVWDRVHRYIFRRREIETATEGTVTAIETIDESGNDRYAEPVVSVYAVTSEKNCAQ